EVKKAADDTKPSPGQREFWIEPNSFSVFARGLSICLVTVLIVLDRETAQISVVRSSILRWPIGDGLLLAARELSVELLGDCARDFAFDSKNIIQFAIVTLGPKMFVGRGANQLDVDVNSVGDFLN